jgi:alanine racemase
MQNKLPLSYIEISKGNLIHNIKQFRGLIGPETKLACVVKANAYGHGDTQVVKILNSYVDYFQVNSIDELERVRKVTKKDVLVLGYVGKNDIARALELKGTLGIFDLEHALLVNQIACKLNKKIKVHLAVDSHLGREGVMPETLEIILPEILKMKNIIVDGVYSHFANIEDTTDFSHAQKQIDTYADSMKIFEKHGFKKIKKHISATSGVLAYESMNNKKDLGTSIVRVGIGSYGMWPSVELEDKWKKKIELKPVLKWVTHIAQVKKLPKGHTIGYGLAYVTKRPMSVAILPQGYSDGLTRSITNRGHVLIGGQIVSLLGRVAMNMVVADVSSIPDVASGDEVIIIGKQGDCSIGAEDLAREMDTINYEVTTHISALLPRKIGA